jgi:hypothetical protein
MIDEVLRENARHERLADAALLAADEMNVSHEDPAFQCVQPTLAREDRAIGDCADNEQRRCALLSFGA